jgi:hypothetical protein
MAERRILFLDHRSPQTPERILSNDGNLLEAFMVLCTKKPCIEEASMAEKSVQYEFRIDAFTPETLPMARLAEYMSDLAVLLGNVEKVHFVRLKKGSTVLVHNVEWEAAPKVVERIHAIKRSEGPPDAMKAYDSIDRRLASDNAIGYLTAPSKDKVIEFPGRSRPESAAYGPFTQPGAFDGIPIMIGGKTDPVPVHLEEGDVVHLCYSSREIAKRLAAHLFVSFVRVTGNGRWHRDPDGIWVMDRFTINDFSPLKDEPLEDAVARLRTAAGKPESEDVISELNKIRHGSDRVQ